MFIPKSNATVTNDNNVIGTLIMAKSKPLDLDYIFNLLDYNTDTGKVFWRVSTGKAKAGSEAGSIHSATGYIRMTIGGRAVGAHRVAWSIHHKEQPPAIIDHIDGDRTNNKIENLRDGTNGKNQQNQTKPHSRNKSSKYLGVSLFKGRWRAKIYHNKTYYFLGFHDTEELARDAYIEAKRRLHAGCEI
ncbi:AP2/ERF domain protein [Vibrio phage 1.165.O._10N.261.51.B7]|nr:AP2/ERF domain protein [Vibrio phage 1.157.O._10N.261.45.B7]AUR91807.1 AP2/ERF domain protein [Vibrio phage 1.165.O._10N.261.51.B7]